MIIKRKIILKIYGFSGGSVKWLIGSFLIFFFTSCNDKIDVAFEIRLIRPDIIKQESFVLEISETRDSCVYIYDNGKEDIEWVNHRFIIDRLKKELYFHYNDDQDIGRAKKTGEKIISVKNQKRVIECYMNEGRGDLFFLFFTEGYGLLLMKYDTPERVLVKFDNKISEINDMINMIKSDEEFYKWGGRKHFDPPPID